MEGGGSDKVVGSRDHMAGGGTMWEGADIISVISAIDGHIKTEESQ